LNQSHFIARLPNGPGAVPLRHDPGARPGLGRELEATNVRLSGTGDDARLTMLVG